MPGSGKGLIVEVAKSLGFYCITMGDIVREEVRKRGLKVTVETLNSVAEELRVKEGKDAIAKRIVEKLKVVNAKYILIDGVRSLDEIKCFERTLGKPIIIAIHASPKTRFKRLLQRGRPGDPKSWNEFLKRDFKELEFGIGNVIALADYMIVNEAPKEEILESIRRVLKEVIRVVESHSQS